MTIETKLQTWTCECGHVRRVVDGACETCLVTAPGSTDMKRYNLVIPQTLWDTIELISGEHHRHVVDEIRSALKCWGASASGEGEALQGKRDRDHGGHLMNENRPMTMMPRKSPTTSPPVTSAGAREDLLTGWGGLRIETETVRLLASKCAGDPERVAEYVYGRASAYVGMDHQSVAVALFVAALQPAEASDPDEYVKTFHYWMDEFAEAYFDARISESDEEARKDVHRMGTAKAGVEVNLKRLLARIEVTS